MPKVNVRIIGAKQARRALQFLERGARSQFELALLKAAKSVEGDAKRMAPRDTGTLQRSVTSGLVAIGPFRITAAVGTAQPHGAPFEFGRGPSKKSGSVPLWKSDTFRRWVRKKTGDVNLAFVIARKIHEKGFQARPYLRPAIDSNKTRIKNFLATAMKISANQAGKEGRKNA